MKKLILALFTLIITAKAYAQYPDSTNYEFYYKGYLVETSGNFFLGELLILPRKDMVQTPSKGVVDSFRNIFTAYETQELKWLDKYTKGNKKDKEKYTNKFLKQFSQDELFYMLGYVNYSKYVIVLLQHKATDQRSIYVMEKGQQLAYVPSANFEKLFPKQYLTIEQAFKGNGEFKVEKN